MCWFAQVTCAPNGDWGPLVWTFNGDTESGGKVFLLVITQGLQLWGIYSDARSYFTLSLSACNSSVCSLPRVHVYLIMHRCPLRLVGVKPIVPRPMDGQQVLARSQPRMVTSNSRGTKNLLRQPSQVCAHPCDLFSAHRAANQHALNCSRVARRSGQYWWHDRGSRPHYHPRQRQLRRGCCRDRLQNRRVVSGKLSACVAFVTCWQFMC